ncbi:hypothetical protein [Motilimonas pumila]|uniref:Uncharacterized protein n=1 Tax=Motilimonas pumila TaxID=2303987 RepID=A0A418YDL2_9GAMM|nr:hypothetical protein [Motilimonas pumila]RJG42594.1 hypothetical protein D1Z90_12045 [Motilimonas pumila]
MTNLKPSIIALTCAFAITACGGGSSSNDSTPTETPLPTPTTAPELTEQVLNITVIDGYLNGAQVWLDLNNNSVLDAGEPNTFSSEGGIAQLVITGIENVQQFPIVAKAIGGQTIDEDTNLAVATDFLLTAPAGNYLLTPITTLIQQGIKQGLSIEEASLQVASQLQLPLEQLSLDYIALELNDVATVARTLIRLGIIPSTSAQAESEQWQNKHQTTLTKVGSLIAEVKSSPTNISFKQKTIIINQDGQPELKDDQDGDGRWDYYDENDQLYSVDNPPSVWPDQADRHPTEADACSHDTWNGNNWNELKWN